MELKTLTHNLIVDKALANHPFEQATCWCVFTGAPCAGKTTLLESLSQHGFKWYPEIARVYVEQKLSDWENLQTIRAEEGKFQRGLIDAKVALELNADPTETILFDRAMPDSITYYRVAGLDPREVLSKCFHRRYAKVFILDPLPFIADNARTEDEGIVAFLDFWLECDYRALGYDVVRVPVMSISERTQLVLAHIRGLPTR